MPPVRASANIVVMSWQRRARLAVLSAVVAVLGFAASASAATVRLDVRTVRQGQVAELVYQAAPGERNRVEISDGPAELGADSIELGALWVGGSLRSTIPGSGCALVTVPDWEQVPQRFIRCAIPAGERPGGAVVHLGDRSDTVTVELARGRARVFGGTGHDGMSASRHDGTYADFLLDGGPGNDRLGGSGRLSGRSGNDSLTGSGRLYGGRGHDGISGSGRLSGGPGFDHISGSGRLFGGPGRDEIRGSKLRDVIRARDGSVDFVTCGAGRDSALLDGRDTYALERPGSYPDWKQPSPRECERIRRRGAARAAPIFVWGDAESVPSIPEWGVDVGCPPDGPAVCVGDVTVFRSGRRAIGRQRFRISRGTADYGGWWDSASLSLLTRVAGQRVWVRVRSYDRQGRLQIASAPFRFLVEWPAYDS